MPTTVHIRGLDIPVPEAAKLIGVSRACLYLRLKTGGTLDAPSRKGPGSTHTCDYCKAAGHLAKTCTLALRDLMGAARVGLLDT